MTVVWVCIPSSAGNPGGFDDNRYGKCSECGVEVIYRPNAPADSIKVCMDCALKTHGAQPITVTPEVLAEFMAWAETQK